MILDDIRGSIKKFIPTAVFSYGRSFDAALASATVEIDEWFIHLDPISFNGTLNEFENAVVNIVFLKQDKPDSEFDKAQNLEISKSIEEIHSEAKDKAISWVNDFLDNYLFSGSSYTLTPAIRVKNVMSGVLLNLTISYKPSC